LGQGQENVPSLRDIYTFDPVEGKKCWSELSNNSFAIENLNIISDNIRPSDTATIIYTSGTTGNPKGVMLSHENVVSNVLAVRHCIPIYAGEKALSFLPLCHVFERVVSHAYAYIGVNVTYSGTDNLAGEEGDLKRVKPHFFTTVPRLLEKVYEKIYNKGLELTGPKRAIFFWALKMTDNYEYDKKFGTLNAMKWKIADSLIFSKWREALGGNLKGIIIGAAPCPIKIARTFSAAGVAIREGYGLTEASPGISINRFDAGKSKLGTVGPPIDNVEVRIDGSDGNYREGEGEILMAGPNVMQGYYNKPDETNAMIKTIDGKRWLYTGDIGTLIQENGVSFLKITDRKKELFKTSGGKYVAPAPIESRLKEHYLIEQVMLVGDNQKFVSALIIPAAEPLKDWCKGHQVPWTTQADVLQHPTVISKYQRVVERYNPEFAHVEQIKKITLLNTTWESEKKDGTDAELTPTLKVKRRVILSKHQKEIEAMYS
jgi:long-chain acyl-CoA synthetase